MLKPANFYDDIVEKAKPPERPSVDITSFANGLILAEGWGTRYYRHRKHALTDVLHPTYFWRAFKDFNIRRGDTIHCILGEPEDALEVMLMVCSIDTIAQTVRVSKRDNRGKFVFVSHPDFDSHAKDAAA